MQVKRSRLISSKSNTNGHFQQLSSNLTRYTLTLFTLFSPFWPQEFKDWLHEAGWNQNTWHLKHLKKIIQSYKWGLEEKMKEVGKQGEKGRKDFTLVSLFLINHNDYKWSLCTCSVLTSRMSEIYIFFPIERMSYLVLFGH